MMKPFGCFMLMSLSAVCGAWAEVRMPPIFSDHAVLQRGASVPIWGWGSPNETVTVVMGTNRWTTASDASGAWSLRMDLRGAPQTPFDLRIQAGKEHVLRDVLVGEVWLAGGQSNMEFSLAGEETARTEIPASANPLLRQFLVSRRSCDAPTAEAEGCWTVASPRTSGGFSAVAYFFGKQLQRELHVPVGLVVSRWGGTPVESWTSPEALDTVPALRAERERLRQSFLSYPGRRNAFIRDFGRWLEQSGRRDRPVADAAAFASCAADASWTRVTLPNGDLTVPGGIGTGAVWIKKTVVLSSNPGGRVRLELPQSRGYPSIYWNGKRVRNVTFADLPETGLSSWHFFPDGAIQAGTNTLAIRLFAPSAPVHFFGTLRLGPVNLNGDWWAKAEFVLPPLTREQMARVPTLPANPPIDRNVYGWLFNGMIHPLIPYALRGVIWYQGETNTGRAFDYRVAFPLMIRDWRTRWGEGDFPFYFCQLANYMEKTRAPGESRWAELRESQTRTLTVPNTGQAVLIDLGEAENIHPLNKREVGSRLARLALARDYGKALCASGPVCRTLTREDDRMRLFFDYTEGGLVARPLPTAYDVNKNDHTTRPLVRNSPHSTLEGFAVCGTDRRWVWANAAIDGATVIVWSPHVSAPVAVRYAWADNPTCNLYNGAGLPASPFRTDTFPLTTEH